jgi:hypothetical protein
VQSVTEESGPRGGVGEGGQGPGRGACHGVRGGQQVTTHPLSRIVTMRSPRSPYPVLVMAMSHEGVCALCECFAYKQDLGQSV